MFKGILASVALTLVVFALGQTAYSQGSLRFILPFISTIGGESLREGELAYDDSSMNIVLSTAEGIRTLQEKRGDYSLVGFPLIESSISHHPSTDEAYINSEIGPGEIYIGNKMYKNTNTISCLLNQDDPVTGLGEHDGSAMVVASAFYVEPTYLYLVGDGSGFNCIYSYSHTGPIAPYDNERWIRVQSIVGKRSGYPLASFITKDGETKLRNFQNALMQFSLTSFGSSPLTDSSRLLPSMMSVFIAPFRCSSGTTFQLLELTKMYLPPLSTYDDMFVATEGSCIGSIQHYETAPLSEYFMKGSEEIHYTGTGSYSVFIDIHGWRETPLSSH